MNLPEEKILILFTGQMIIVLSLIYIAACTFIPIPDSGLDIAKITVGFFVGTGFGTIVTYFFGSSHGSAQKSDIINERMKSDDCKEEKENVRANNVQFPG